MPYQINPFTGQFDFYDVSFSVWGSITGTLSNQTDLQSALDDKLDSATASTTYVPYTGATTDVDLGNNSLTLSNYFLATGILGSGWTEPNIGAGTRLLWYPKKASFRAGYVVSTKWNDANIGLYSFGSGYNPLSSGYASFAAGESSQATGYASLAIGSGNIATNDGAVAIGASTQANGQYSLAAGYYNVVNGNNSFATGYSNNVSSNNGSVFGELLINSSYDSTVFGRYNVGGGNTTAWVDTDYLLELGNGTGPGSLSNAFSVLKNGKTTVGGNLSLATGTTSIAPLTFTSGILKTNSGIGDIEFSGDDYYVGITTPITGSQYPPAQSTTYVKSTTQFSAGYEPFKATDPTKSITGSLGTGAWVSGNTIVTNQSFHIDLGAKKVIDQLYYENGHNFGGSTNTGANNFTIWGSNSSTAFADTTYATDTNWTQLTTDISQFVQHIAVDTADPHYVAITNQTGYRYYRIKVADNWGNAAYITVRRFELQVTNNYRKGVVLTDGSVLTSTKIPVGTTNGRLIDSNLTINSTGVGNIATPLYSLDMSGNVRLGSTLKLGHEYQGVSSGWVDALTVYASGAERSALSYNWTTGKLGYFAEGGTQGLWMGTAGRSIVIDGRDRAGGTKFTATSGYGTTHIDAVADFNNAAQKYIGFNYNFIDTASATTSQIFNLQLGGVDKFSIRKDGTQFNYAGHVENTTRTATTPYVVLATDYVVYVDSDGGAMAVTLPAGIDGTTYKIVNVGSSGNNVTITPNGAETIRGGATLVLTDGLQALITYETTEKWW